MELAPAPTIYEGFCPIVPVPKGRPRFTRAGHAYTPAATRKYEDDVRKWFIRSYGKNTSPMDGCLAAEYEFILPRPTSTSKKQWFSKTKPDVDNFVKAFQDALDFKAKVNGIALGVIANDSRVSSLYATKRYVVGGEIPGTRFAFYAVDSCLMIISDDVSTVMRRSLSKSMRTVSLSELKLLKLNGIKEAWYVSGDEPLDAVLEVIKSKIPGLEELHIV